MAIEMSFCPRCKVDVSAAIEPGPQEDEWRGRRCPECGGHWWVKKADNEAKRSDKNARHRKGWRDQQGGEMVCLWCGVAESETKAAFEIDHVKPLEDGGVDEFQNTRPLCCDCHTIRSAMRAHAKHVAGKSARTQPEVV